MKLLALLSAGLVAAAVLPAASATAQTTHYTVVRTTHVTTKTVAHHNGRHAHWRNVCKTSWQHHHKVRSCHKVKYWS
jgi:hypothetical protein